MNKLDQLLSGQTNQTLSRRANMARVLESSLREAPNETEELIGAILKAYQSGKITRFWDFLAVLSGNDRGFGNDWLYTAIEIRKQIKNGK